MQTSVGFVLPDKTTDCHVHVFDPDRFPYASDRRYTPLAATADELAAVHRRLGVERAVLVQPSVYGTDNRCLLAALDQFGGGARGVAVIGDGDDAARLGAMHASGVRGVRLNLQVTHESDIASIRSRVLRLSQQLGSLQWVIQIYASLPVIVAIADTLTALPQRVLIDHFGMAKAVNGTSQTGFPELLSLVSHPSIHVKLSGPYQISKQGPAYPDIAPIARNLFSAAPTRTVWGSDWPHPGGAQRPVDAKPGDVEPFRQEDDARNLGLVAEWFPDADARRQLLVDNPSRLFGFDEQA
jgi:2-pyrone-4,6-dicarboxylate lactonase